MCVTEGEREYERPGERKKGMNKGERERDVIFHKFVVRDLDKQCSSRRCIIIVHVYSFPLYRVGFSLIFWHSLRSRKGTALMGVAHAHFPPYG